MIMATKKGLVKKTPFVEYDSTRKEGLNAITLKDDDELIEVRLTKGDQDVLLVSRKGQAIRFKEADVRPMGRTAMGVKGINLAKGDLVIGMGIAREDADLFIVTEKGYGKRTPVSKYPLQARGGKGVRTINLVAPKGFLAGQKIVKKNHELMISSSEGILIRVPVEGIPVLGRNTQGVKIMNLTGKDRVSALARMVVGSPPEDKA